MFGSTNPFGQSSASAFGQTSSNPFGAQSGFGQTSTATNPFGSPTTAFGAQTGTTSPFGATSSTAAIHAGVRHPVVLSVRELHASLWRVASPRVWRGRHILRFRQWIFVWTEAKFWWFWIIS
ncbi:hypothetical protein ZWY2020_033674 [Hordeum vulgare]|nr:hypothetical protein ZWY2020_033674 [Hordeum vulgare]